MEQTLSREARRFSSSQEIPRIVWNQKVRYRTHQSPPLVPILNQNNPVHVPSFNFLKIHLKIIFPSMFGSSKRALSLRFPHQTLYAPFLSPYVLHAPAHLILDLITRIIQLLVMLYLPILFYLVPLRPKYLPQHHILEHPQPTFLFLHAYSKK